jgi:hypothetical protein
MKVQGQVIRDENAIALGKPHRGASVRSQWRIFPGDIDITLGWAPETNLAPLKVDREIGSHVLISETGPVRAIPSAKAGLSGK